MMNDELERRLTRFPIGCRHSDYFSFEDDLSYKRYCVKRLREDILRLEHTICNLEEQKLLKQRELRVLEKEVIK